MNGYCSLHSTKCPSLKGGGTRFPLVAYRKAVLASIYSYFVHLYHIFIYTHKGYKVVGGFCNDLKIESVIKLIIRNKIDR